MSSKTLPCGIASDLIVFDLFCTAFSVVCNISWYRLTWHLPHYHHDNFVRRTEAWVESKGYSGGVQGAGEQGSRWGGVGILQLCEHLSDIRTYNVPELFFSLSSWPFFPPLQKGKRVGTIPFTLLRKKNSPQLHPQLRFQQAFQPLVHAIHLLICQRTL